MKGYKVFNPDWTCRGFQFEVGKIFEEEGEPKCCEKGFHFCTRLVDCFGYYEFNPKNKVAEIEALGEIDTDCEKTKKCTNKIKIIKELSWQEVLEILNTGYDNSGYGNSGNNNNGNNNSGNGNSGNNNSGNGNSGYSNSGDCNIGNRNSGDFNSGYVNSGNHNSGNYNCGHYNSGYHNCGNYNSGDYNSGHHNSGDYNSGNYNSGNYNSGDYNSGNYNSGDWNSSDWNVGCFNTNDNYITMFNKPTNWTYEDWFASEACEIMYDCPIINTLDWGEKERMTEEEKRNNPTYLTTGGYLKEISHTNNDRQQWWDSLDEDDKACVMDLPNFDKEIFKEITGIDVDKAEEEQ